MLLTKKDKAELKALIEQTKVRTVEELILKFETDLMEKVRAYLESEADNLFQRALEADRKRRYESDEPFVEIVSEHFDAHGGVELKLDWNKAFIDHLKQNGFGGHSDEEIVDNWLLALSRTRTEQNYR